MMILFLKKKKVLNKSLYEIFGCNIKGFEIHHGQSKKYPLSFESSKIKGTFVHGIFENDNIRNKIFSEINSDYKSFNFYEYKNNEINTFIDTLKSKLNIDLVMENINE